MDSVIIREASFDDESAVQCLCQRNGLVGERSDQAWSWIWRKNRFYSDNWKIGWVLESGGVVVGFIGNIPRAYSYKGRKWIAGVARSIVVDESFRRHTLKLVVAFFQQKKADLLIFSSSNSNAASLWRRKIQLNKQRYVGASIIPQQDYNKDLFWIVSPCAFIYSILRKKKVWKLFSFFVSCMVGPFISLEMFLRRRWSYYSIEDIHTLSPAEFTDEMDELWSKIQKKYPFRLLSYRDREALTWQFSNDTAETQEPVFITLRKDGMLTGYVIMTRLDSPKYDLKRMMITDLISYDDDPEVIRSLIKEAFVYSKQNKTAILQMVGFPSTVRSALKPLHPFIHALSYYPFWYYAVNPDLKDELQIESIWYASTFDGDSTF